MARTDSTLEMSVEGDVGIDCTVFKTQQLHLLIMRCNSLQSQMQVYRVVQKKKIRFRIANSRFKTYR